jgi:ABC-type sugar transport system substrate-binding protein
MKTDLKACALALASLLLVPAAARGADKLKIGLSMDSLESAFWVANHDAIVAKAKAMGVGLVEVMAEGDPAKQNQQMENLIAQKVDAIICAPKDGAAIVASAKKAQAAGIPVIMDNRPVQGKFVPALSLLSDNYAMAKAATQWFVDRAKKEGKTYKAILLVGNLADENAVERLKGHKEVIDANKGVITVVAQIPTEWNHEVALKGLQNALQANPDVTLLITPSDFLYPPIKSALEQVKKWAKIGQPNHVAIVSFDGDEGGMQYLKDGYSEVDAAQSAAGTGELAVEWAIKLKKGEKPPQPIYRDPGIIVNVDNFKELAPKVWSYGKLK